MKYNDEKVMLIDPSIEINKYKLPKLMQNIIKELEQYDRENDWVMYDGVSEGLEAAAKQCLITGIINNNEFNLLLRKYRSGF